MQPRHNTHAELKGASARLYHVEGAGPNDVLFGRGTGSNTHAGNIRFRALIQKYQPLYRETPKKLKPSVSTKVVAIWRAQDPPGRFLTRSDRYHGSRRTFYDVGDAAARRKAAQCLREKSSRERLETSAGKLAAAALVAEDKDESTQHDGDLLKMEEQLDCSSDQFLGEGFAGDLDQEGDNEMPPTTGAFVKSSDLGSAKDEFTSSGDFSFVSQFLFPKEESGVMFPSLNIMCHATSGSNIKQAPGASQDEPMSLSDVLGSHQMEREDCDPPFTMAWFDFGDGEESEGGLSFPSLSNGSSAFPSLGGVGSFGFPSLDDPSPYTITVSQPVVKTRADALRTIGNAVPTAAYLLTANIFGD